MGKRNGQVKTTTRTGSLSDVHEHHGVGVIELDGGGKAFCGLSLLGRLPPGSAVKFNCTERPDGLLLANNIQPVEQRGKKPHRQDYVNSRAKQISVRLRGRNISVA